MRRGFPLVDSKTTWLPLKAQPGCSHDEKKITEEFLRLFSRDWNDPAAHEGFRELRELVPGQRRWQEIIDAWPMTLEKKTAESIALLKEILTLEPHNFCASLLLASILCRENDQPEEAISTYDSLLQQGFEDQALEDWMQAFTLFNKGVALGQMGKYEEEIGVYDEVVERFGESAAFHFGSKRPKPWSTRVRLLGRWASPRRIRVYDEVVDRFGDSADLWLREAVAEALYNKGVTLGDMGKPKEAIGLYSRSLSDW